MEDGHLVDLAVIVWLTAKRPPRGRGGGVLSQPGYAPCIAALRGVGSERARERDGGRVRGSWVCSESRGGGVVS